MTTPLSPGFGAILDRARLDLAGSSVSAEPFSKSKTSNWVAKAGGLPHFIQHMAHDIMEGDAGKTESAAIAIAISQCKKLAAKGNAKAAKAVAEWEELKAKNAAKSTDASAQVGALPGETALDGARYLLALSAAREQVLDASAPARYPGGMSLSVFNVKDIKRDANGRFATVDALASKIAALKPASTPSESDHVALPDGHRVYAHKTGNAADSPRHYTVYGPAASKKLDSEMHGWQVKEEHGASDPVDAAVKALASSANRGDASSVGGKKKADIDPYRGGYDREKTLKDIEAFAGKEGELPVSLEAAKPPTKAELAKLGTVDKPRVEPLAIPDHWNSSSSATHTKARLAVKVNGEKVGEIRKLQHRDRQGSGYTTGWRNAFAEWTYWDGGGDFPKQVSSIQAWTKADAIKQATEHVQGQAQS